VVVGRGKRKRVGAGWKGKRKAKPSGKTGILPTGMSALRRETEAHFALERPARYLVFLMNKTIMKIKFHEPGRWV